MPPTVTLSVVIPSSGRLPQVAAMAGRWADQGADQVVVVLDGPHRGARAAFADAGVAVGTGRVELVVLPEHRGRSVARSIGLAHATGDAVLLADDDVLPGDGLVDRHRAFHARHPDAALLGWMPVRLPARRGPDDAPTFVYARDYDNQVALWRQADDAGLLASFWTGNASVGRALLERAEAIRPMDRLGYNEDLDLGMRLATLGATARFDERAAAVHLHARSIDAFLAECVVRGEAVADLEARWPALPDQIRDLVRIPPDHPRLAARLQAGIGARDTPGATEALLRTAYRVAGLLRTWGAQDAIARFLRRALAIRGYRTRHATPPHPECLTQPPELG